MFLLILELFFAVGIKFYIPPPYKHICHVQ